LSENETKNKNLYKFESDNDGDMEIVSENDILNAKIDSYSAMSNQHDILDLIAESRCQLILADTANSDKNIVLCKNRKLFLTSYLNGLIDFYNLLIRLKKFILLNFIFLITLFGLLRVPFVFLWSFFNLSSLNYDKEKTLKSLEKPKSQNQLEKFFSKEYDTDFDKINEVNKNDNRVRVKILNRTKSKKRNITENFIKKNGNLTKIRQNFINPKKMQLTSICF
jgi:hypothetical protein